MSAVLRLVGVTQQYGEGETAVSAQSGVDLTVDKGELVAIMGASGSGKSTLLSIAGGLQQPTSGEVVVEDTYLSTASARQLAALRRRSLGFVFQDFNLIPTLTALENVTLPLELDGFRARVARRAGRDALSSVGLEDKVDSYPDDLSGGQQQRVAIARAVVGGRRLILADEPVSVRVSRPLWGTLLSAVGIALTVASAVWLSAINAEPFVPSGDARRQVCIWGIIAGPILLQLGVILGGHWIIAQLARAISRLGLAPRIASRDAAASPGRIVPAFAAIAACAFLATAALGAVALSTTQAQRGYWWNAPIDTMSVTAFAGGAASDEPVDAATLASMQSRARDVLERTDPRALGTAWIPRDAATYGADGRLVDPEATVVAPEVQHLPDCAVSSSRRCGDARPAKTDATERSSVEA